MELQALLRRYLELRAELADAYRCVPWQSARLDPLTNDLVEIEQRIAVLRPQLVIADVAGLSRAMPATAQHPG